VADFVADWQADLHHITVAKTITPPGTPIMARLKTSDPGKLPAQNAVIVGFFALAIAVAFFGGAGHAPDAAASRSAGRERSSKQSGDAAEKSEVTTMDNNSPAGHHTTETVEGNTHRVLGDDGHLIARGEFSGQQPDGPFTSFHKNGQAAVSGQMKSGQLAGQWTAWHQNGTKAIEGSFKAGVRDGAWMYWDTDGLKKRLETYRAGRPAGIWVYWDAKGNIWRRKDCR
jgi:hypothetical protein